MPDLQKSLALRMAYSSIEGSESFVLTSIAPRTFAAWPGGALRADHHPNDNGSRQLGWLKDLARA